MVLPDRMPPEWLVLAVAEEPLFEPPAAFEPPQALGATWLPTATASTWLVHRFRPRSIGICTVLPDRMPLESFTVLVAEAPAPDPESAGTFGAAGLRT